MSQNKLFDFWPFGKKVTSNNNKQMNNDTAEQIVVATDEEKEMKSGQALTAPEWEQLHSVVDKRGYKAGAEFLVRKIKEEEQVIAVGYTFKAFAHEGAYAVFQAVTELYGKLEMNTQNGPSGRRPPKLINIQLPDGDYIKVPWGQVQLPTFDNESSLQISWDGDDNIFHVNGEVKRKYQEEVERVAKLVQHKLDNNSIYQGRAVTMDLGGKSGREYYNEPKFLDLSNVNAENIIISSKTLTDLNPVIQRITKSELCKSYGLDLKFGALLEGPYGTGKTLVAFMLAKMAVDNNWTFIYLEDCRDMARALRVAESFTKGDSQGCVIFTEDIDQVLRGERRHEMQEILNVIDGGDTKGKPIISIFTTNHLELIEPTFLRGKRIGKVVSMGALDEETSIQFIKKIAVNQEGISLMANEDWEKASKELCGIVPAFAHEVIDASKIYMIARGDDKINDEDIALAAASYKRQMEVAECHAKDPEQHKVAKALSLIGDGLDGNLGD